MPPPNTLPELITTGKELAQLLELVAAANVVALDTEFVRTNTYAPHLGLLQIHVGTTITCVDPLAGIDISPLWQLLLSAERILILHSAKQDMEVIWFEQQALPANLIDTQICAALLGFPAQIGYAGIAGDIVGASVSKDQTRTDWSRRPLSRAQIQYALEDVEHLPEVHATLRARLEALGRYEWALEDSAAMLDHKLYEPDPAGAWQRIKSVPYLPVEQQARARALAEWREQRAVSVDKPRGWILSDKALLQLAEANPKSEQQLGRVEDLPGAVVRKQGRKLLAIIRAANEALAAGELELTQAVPERDQDKSTLKNLSALVRAKAAELGIAPEVLASKRDLQALLRDEPDPKVLQGWRKAEIGDRLLAAKD
jgi:ribonuclease D